VVLDEPISPELALVCPDLRERAIAALPDLEFWAVVRAVRVPAPVPVPVPQSRRAAVLVRQGLGALLVPLAALAFCSMLTLVLTLVADSLR
jgi:hypothetical protein